MADQKDYKKTANHRTAFDKLRQRGAEDWVSLQQMLKKAPLPERVAVEGSIFN